MNLDFDCEKVEIKHSTAYKINVEIVGADDGDILNHFTTKDIISHFDEDELLQEIGEEKAKKFFDIE